MNRIQNPEISPWSRSPWILNKGAKIYIGEKLASSTNGGGTTAFPQ
jgi:hypothetical protein